MRRVRGAVETVQTMRIRREHLWLVVTTAAVIAAAFSLLTKPIAAQNAAYRAPRFVGTEHPDLSGIWQALNTANWDIQAHAAENGPFPGLLGAWGAVPAGLGVVEGNEIPYQPWALEKKKENFSKRLTADPFNFHASGDPEAKCYLPGVPRATYVPFPFQILLSDKDILLSYEFDSATRIIHMDAPKESPLDFRMGWSNGHWQGDTLVVDVTGLNGLAWFDRAGNFASDTLHVVERYTLAGSDHINYEATIEDPAVFTRPWKIRLPLYRRVEKNAQLLEFKCVEFAEELLYGQFKKQPAK